MAEAMKVYVLAYDDGETYHIYGVFSSKELAKKTLNACKERTWLVVEEFELDREWQKP